MGTHYNDICVKSVAWLLLTDCMSSHVSQVTDLIPNPRCRLQVTLLSHHISLGISQLEPVAFDRLVFKLYAHPPGFVIPIPLQLHVSR